MGQLAKISTTFFTGLINRLGLRPPFNEGFLMSNVVQPVSLVDSDITLAAVVTTHTLNLPFTAGQQTNPAANTVLADSGAVLVAGDYFVTILSSVRDNTNPGDIVIQRRDAANAANIWEQRLNGTIAAGFQLTHSLRCSLQASERIRVLNVNGGAVSSNYHVNIWLSS